MTAVVKGATTRAIPTDKMAMGASALALIADIQRMSWHVRYVPLADIGSVARTEESVLARQAHRERLDTFHKLLRGIILHGRIGRPWGSGATATSRVVSSMEQRRFFEVMGEESGEWLVLDGKRHPPRVICRCRGWNAPKNAALIVAALEAHHSELHSKFPLDGSGRPAVKPGLPSSEAESAPAPKPATRKSRAGHRG